MPPETGEALLRRLTCQVCGRTLSPLKDGTSRRHYADRRRPNQDAYDRSYCRGSGYRLARWEVGQKLRHHAGDVWEVVEDRDATSRWGDYLIRCVVGTRSFSGDGWLEAPGKTMVAHGEYLHRDGWRPLPRDPDGRARTKPVSGVAMTHPLPSRNTFQNGDPMSTLDLTREHVTVCRGRCTRDCQHGQPRDGAMELDPTFCAHPQVHYKPVPGYTAEQASVGASVMCEPCLIAIGVRADGDWVEEKAIAEVWKGFIRVRDYVLGSATRTPHLDRSYAHWPCRWQGAANWHDQANHAGGNPDEPVPETVYCPRCEKDFPTLVNWGNSVTEPDPRAELAGLLAELGAKTVRDAA